MIDWQVIIKKHGPGVWRTAYRLLGNHEDAADCFQETFICALEFSRRQNVRNFSALLVHIATSRAIDHLRRRIRHSQNQLETPDLTVLPAEGPEPSEQIQTRESTIKLRTALGRLPAQEAQVFCLRYLDDMSYRQIAEQLCIKTGNVGVLLHRARIKLRDIIEIPPINKSGMVL